MGWFDEQIRQRKRLDEELYQNSFDTISRKVLGEKTVRKDRKAAIKTAIDDILYYFHYPKVDIPANIEDPYEQIDYAVGTVGMMKANIEVGKGWYTDSYGPVIAFFKENDMPIALFPLSFSGYYYYDPETGDKKIIGKKTATLFKNEVVAFYEPLALKKLGISDLIAYMKNRLDLSDVLMYVVASGCAVGVSMLLPYAGGILSGKVLDEKNYTLFSVVALAVIVTIFLNWLFSSVVTAITSQIEWKVSVPVEQAIMQRLLTLPVPFFREYSAGELSSRSETVNSICRILITNVFGMGISSVISLAYVGQIVGITPCLAKPALAIIMITVFLSVASTIIQMGVTKKHMELLAKEHGLSYAIILGIQKIKLAGAEKRVFAKWASEYAEGAAMAYNPPFFLKINSALTVGASLLGTFVFYTVAITNNVSVSEYYSFTIAYNALFAAFSALSSASLSIAQIKPVLEMAEPLLKAEPEKTLKKDIVTKLSGSIQMDGVYFKYSEQDKYILENFNLKIRAGEYVGIVGKTGCGKSTLVRLLLGFEKPEKGAVFYDGKDIERIDLKSLRRKIGTVIQDGKLFYGDIFQNISIASEKLTMDEAWEAAEMAGIADDIREMPMGMYTIISEGQGGISGGQRQRLLIARAVASKPKVLIFDEATSALDNITQKQIAESLDGLKCTRIVIAHRLSTIKNCDRILVMDGGKIAEMGKYDELIEKKGLFYELVERQQL